MLLDRLDVPYLGPQLMAFAVDRGFLERLIDGSTSSRAGSRSPPPRTWPGSSSSSGRCSVSDRTASRSGVFVSKTSSTGCSAARSRTSTVSDRQRCQVGRRRAALRPCTPMTFHRDGASRVSRLASLAVSALALQVS